MPDLLTSRLLTSIEQIRFGMSTRKSTLSAEAHSGALRPQRDDRLERIELGQRILREQLGIQGGEVAIPKQCHSATVLVVDSPGAYESCDGLVTAEKHLGLAVVVADCVPLMLVDARRHVVAALHAGWRGTAGRIAERGLDLMRTNFGTEPSDVKAFIGPSADVCCYEVGEEVFSQFPEAARVRKNGSVHLDLKGENQRQLLEAGVPAEQIEVSPYCTICTPDLFHSYRRDRERSGRMVAVIALMS